LEYRRATERNIPRLIFMMDESVSVAGTDMEKNPDGSAKLLRLKAELGKGFVMGFFKSPESLFVEVIVALAKHLKSGNSSQFSSLLVPSLVDIPRLPTPYIAHKYNLLKTETPVGRQKEITLLTHWTNDETNQFPILAIIASPGIGKSAL